MQNGDAKMCGALLVSGELVLFKRWLMIFLVARIKVECKFLMVPRAAPSDHAIIIYLFACTVLCNLLLVRFLVDFFV